MPGEAAKAWQGMDWHGTTGLGGPGRVWLGKLRQGMAGKAR